MHVKPRHIHKPNRNQTRYKKYIFGK
jgi:hypothetical protein